MTKTAVRVMGWALALAVSSAVVVRADYDRLQTAATVVREMIGNVAYGVSPDLVAKAKCIAVIPGVKKAALGFGGHYGRGYITCRTDGPGGWTAPGGIRIEGGSVGLQIGGAETDVILLVMNTRGIDRLLASKFTVGADASVAAGPIGRQASAQTDATMTAEILAWSRARGAFAGISLQGSTLRQDDAENRDLYGRNISNKEIIQDHVAPPAGAAALMQELAKH